ncbi:MAG: hypothetical protein KatS3mg034_1265 [Vicingaceae bacterium]|nr:MAG: hypothetical protein KatS3mg034_1265 [Vicingaceae bacterium]
MRKIFIFTVCLAIDMINVLYSQTKVNNKFGNGIINV